MAKVSIELPDIEYVHVSWLTPEQLQDAEIFEMCQTCGNTDKHKKQCPNCDTRLGQYATWEYLPENYDHINHIPKRSIRKRK